MSMTLSDEQELALRTWWDRHHRGNAQVVYYNPGDDPANVSAAASDDKKLLDAIAPLMKPWWVDDNGMLIGPDGHRVQRYGVWNQSGGLPHGVVDRLMAQRICDLLNESEP